MIGRYCQCFSSIKVKVKSPYAILELDRETSQEEIKNKYYQLAQKYHPDRSPHFVEKFKEINEAYNMLKDPSKRKEIDDSIDNKGGVAYSRTYYTNTKHNYGHGTNNTEEASNESQYRNMKSSSSKAHGYQSKSSDYWGKSNFYGKPTENTTQRRSVQKVGELQKAWKNWGVVLLSIGLLFGVVEMVFKVYEMNTREVRKSGEILRMSKEDRFAR